MKNSPFLFGFLLVFISFSISNAQTDTISSYHKHWNYYISFGGGVSLMRNVPQDIYQDGHTNLQAGFFIEKSLNKRFSIISGFEIERNNYSLDGQFIQNQNSLTLMIAPNDVKYTKLSDFIINLPIQSRIYLHKNNHKNTSNAFLQTGLRIGLVGSTSFSYRQSNEKFSESLKDYTKPLIYQWELMIGFKGDFFKKIDFLNASTLGFIYQLSPIFDKQSLTNQLTPIHFTWRFLF
ncbi:MAG: outer membrane beta-barrel protein [Raineya sp.]|jgi:hypothetical protein|nr:outer membrane beta-barrel protein [Raineya sp.]